MRQKVREKLKLKELFNRGNRKNTMRKCTLGESDFKLRVERELETREIGRKMKNERESEKESSSCSMSDKDTV
jgi:hypothetical protein